MFTQHAARGALGVHSTSRQGPFKWSLKTPPGVLQVFTQHAARGALGVYSPRRQGHFISLLNTLPGGLQELTQHNAIDAKDFKVLPQTKGILL